MKDKEEKVMLYIPLGVNTRMDFFTGFGKKELAQCLIGVFFGSFIALLGYVITNQFLTVVIIEIFVVGGSVLATTKNSTNQSVIDYINDTIKFNNEKKSYPYRQVKEW